MLMQKKITDALLVVIKMLSRCQWSQIMERYSNRVSDVHRASNLYKQVKRRLLLSYMSPIKEDWKVYDIKKLLLTMVEFCGI